MVDVLSLLSYSGCVVGIALALAGLQWVVVALQVNMVGGQGQGRRGLSLVWVGVFAVFGWGRHVDHLDVWDAGPPHGQL